MQPYSLFNFAANEIILLNNIYIENIQYQCDLFESAYRINVKYFIIVPYGNS